MSGTEPTGATLSDKTARKEVGLTQDEIVVTIDAGQLQYRGGVIHGNPWLRLLRRKVEELMASTYNDQDHRQRRARAELARVDRDLKKLRATPRSLCSGTIEGGVPQCDRRAGRPSTLEANSPRRMPVR